LKTPVPSTANPDTNEDDIVGFFDAQCPKCDRAIGWQGRLQDKPACRHCGYHKPIDVGVVQKRMRDGKCHARAQELYHEKRNRLSPSECAFVHNVLRKEKNYTPEQRNSVNRIFRKYIRAHS
jgi:hypothetical protein